MKAENNVLIWDIPTRIFHWLLVGGFVAATFMAFVFGEHSPLFPYHAIIGLILGAMVVLRVIWGFVGTKYARFTSFSFSPGAVFNYVTEVLRGVAPPHVGHNPGSAYAIFAMLAMMVGLPLSGIMMGRGGEAFEEVHEFFAYAMILVAAVHILGVVLHTIRHKENITASMIHGRKTTDPSNAISSSRPIVALVFVLLVTTWAWGLVSNYDTQNRSIRLPVFGIELKFEENEDRESREHSSRNGYDGEHGKKHDARERGENHDGDD